MRHINGIINSCLKEKDYSREDNWQQFGLNMEKGN